MKERKRAGKSVSSTEKNQQDRVRRELPKKKISPVIIVALLCVLVYACINIVSAQIELNRRNKEYEEKEYLYAQLTAENESLKNIKETGDIDEYVIKIAREKLNLVFPDDKVYKIIE